MAKKQHKYKIYNFISDCSELEICGYRIAKNRFYPSRIKKAQRKATYRRPIGEKAYELTQYSQTGPNLHLFDAIWSKKDEEPAAILNDDGKLIDDICLLLSIFSGQNILREENIHAFSPYYNGDQLFPDAHLKNLIEKSIETLQSATTNHKKRYKRVLFILQDSLQTSSLLSIASLVSMASDYMAGQSEIKMDSVYEHKLTNLKSSLEANLEEWLSKIPVDNLSANGEANFLKSNVILPFIGKIKSLGEPVAATKLTDFIQTSPVVKNLNVSPEILKSHATAFIHIRNRVVHSGSIPRKLVLDFSSKGKIKIKQKQNDDTLLRAMGVYSFVFRGILIQHLVYQLTGQLIPPYQRALGEFFREGSYNNHDWISQTFEEHVNG